MSPGNAYFKQATITAQPRQPSQRTHTGSVGRPTHADLTAQLGQLARPQPSPEFSQLHPLLAAQYKAIIQTGLPNHARAKLPVSHGLHIPEWEKVLVNYTDSKLVPHLRYGFPLGFATMTKPAPNRNNHTSTLYNTAAVDEYLHTEKRHQAIAGPFKTPPFTPWCHISPMMVRDKKLSTQKRVIVDLSWPLGRSVNSNIPYDVYDGQQASMTLPTAEDLAAAILAAPPSAHLFCLDLSRAYRQLRIDPQDWPLLGLTWRGQFYFDQALAFCGRWHAAACQRVTEALRFLMTQRGAHIWPYLDDIVGLSSTCATAEKHFTELRALMAQLGLSEAHHKAVTPTSKLTWIGIILDLDSMTMTIPLAKLQAVTAAVNHWITQTTIYNS